MASQFTVPQFIDAEDKIIGPITGRQFIIMMVVIIVDIILYSILPFVPFLLIGIPFFGCHRRVSRENKRRHLNANA